MPTEIAQLIMVAPLVTQLTCYRCGRTQNRGNPLGSETRDHANREFCSFECAWTTLFVDEMREAAAAAAAARRRARAAARAARAAAPRRASSNAGAAHPSSR